MMRFKNTLKILILSLTIISLGACVGVGDLTEDTQTVQLGEAKSVELSLHMGSGELELRGGARVLMEGSFIYNVERWKPEVNYSVFEKRGTLRIRQGKTRGVPMGNTKNIWDIRLTNDVPLEINIDFGAGKGTIDLRGLILESIDIDMGVGELDVDLSGERKESLRVKIDGGIGSATVYLPEDIGVHVKVDKGIGSVHAGELNKSGNEFTNEAYGKTDVTIKVEIEAGIGSIDLRLK
jgi:hypothetical protein